MIPRVRAARASAHHVGRFLLLAAAALGAAASGPAAAAAQTWTGKLDELEPAMRERRFRNRGPGINARGQIVGTYFGEDEAFHGFLFEPGEE